MTSDWNQSEFIVVEWEGMKRQENRWSKKGENGQVKDTTDIVKGGEVNG